MAVPTPARFTQRDHARAVIITDRPCPRPPGTWPAALLESSRAYWGCWPGWLTPRHRRGVRHRLAGILGLALCAVVAGARSFTAIAEWAADEDEQTLRMLGITGALPSESTFRRTLQRLDADAFDGLAGSWAARRHAPGPGKRRVIAVDGKTFTRLSERR